MLKKQGDYLKAEVVRKKIEAVKAKEKNSQLRDCDSRHIKENKYLEEQFLQELNEINNFWQTEYEKFEENLTINEKNLEDKHQIEMDELICEDEKQIRIIKYSKEFLDSKNTEANLVKLDR